jgi:hypothetical protein
MDLNSYKPTVNTPRADVTMWRSRVATPRAGACVTAFALEIVAFGVFGELTD